MNAMAGKERERDHFKVVERIKRAPITGKDLKNWNSVDGRPAPLRRSHTGRESPHTAAWKSAWKYQPKNSCLEKAYRSVIVYSTCFDQHLRTPGPLVQGEKGC